MFTLPARDLSCPGYALRPLAARDAEAWLACVSDPRVFGPTSWPRVELADIERTIANIEAGERGAGRWAIVETDSDGLVGTCGVGGVKPGEGTVELAYELAPVAWGKGVATAAVHAFLEQAGQGTSPRRRTGRVLRSRQRTRRGAGVLARGGPAAHGWRASGRWPCSHPGVTGSPPVPPNDDSCPTVGASLLVVTIVLAGIFVAYLAVVAAYGVRPGLPLRAGVWCACEGHRLAAKMLLEPAIWVSNKPAMTWYIDSLYVQAHIEGGRAGPAGLAIALLEHPVLRRVPPELAGTVVNSALNALICAGAYTEAAQVWDRWAEDQRATSGNEYYRLLIEINRVEALYCLGTWDSALAAIEAVAVTAEHPPILQAGWRAQRAWVLAHLNRPQDGLALLAEVTPEQLPPRYRAELHFARATCHLGVGAIAAAQGQARIGERLAVRPSSRKNAQFLLARIKAAGGELEAAEAHCRAAHAVRWRGQGGPGYLLWGEVLLQLGHRDAAERAWKLAVEHDPESESARTALERIAM